MYECGEIENVSVGFLWFYLWCVDFFVVNGEDFKLKVVVYNVIFLYGFLLLLFFWVDMVLLYLFLEVWFFYCLFVVDVFGFGKSLWFDDFLYINGDYVEMICR